GRLGEVERDKAPPPPPGAETEEDKRYRVGDEIGVQGIEKFYDWTLRGARGLRWFRRQPAPAQDALEQEAPARPGLSVQLALDVAAQRAAEEALEGKGGAAVVMDVETGEVVVCASSPGYDLNLDGDGLAALFKSEPPPLVNRAIQAPLPGGSVVKIATAIAGLQSGKITPDTQCVCEGAYYVGQWRFGCSAPHGLVNLAQAIEHSCNVYFYSAARAMGPEILAAWARSLGLGRESGVDLPFEGAGRFPDPVWLRKTQHRPWYLGNTLNTCIGQGDVQITPMQVAVMMAAAANGGKVLRPRLARAVLGPDGRRVACPAVDAPAVARQLPLEVSGLEAIRLGMRDVARTGTARRVKGLAELKVAGKSGTAQTRDRRINHAWFAGFAPWDHPRYAFAVAVQFVEAGGAEGAGPVALETLRPLMNSGPRAED
ncbi:MAG TPA: penicillin-binding transpeptidase domain-containing protein, partial [Candidatus Brocadiia bacterium]|nr:penicillin-binding transpeptidase domain-containing protein [Candidatus Brocadiia bacterium]